MGFLDLFRPAYRHSDEDKRRAAIVEIRDKNLLAKIFRSDPSLDNRLLALVELSGTGDHDFFEPLIESLTQEELAYFLVQKIEEPFHNKSSDWILYALEKETIEKVLTKYRLIGYHTAKTLINQNGKSEAILAILATKVNDRHLLFSAIFKIDDESLLKQVVLGVHPSVAGHLELALEKIRSKELLVEIAMKCSHYPAGLWECLQERGVLSRELLLNIAKNAVNESCRAFALESLDDWEPIIDLLKQGNELGDQITKRLIEQIEDPKILTDIMLSPAVCNDSSESAKIIARHVFSNLDSHEANNLLKHISNSDLLRFLALDGHALYEPPKGLRAKAATKILDIDTLVNMFVGFPFLEEEHGNVKNAIAEQIGNLGDTLLTHLIARLPKQGDVESLYQVQTIVDEITQILEKQTAGVSEAELFKITELPDTYRGPETSHYDWDGDMTGPGDHRHYTSRASISLTRVKELAASELSKRS